MKHFLGLAIWLCTIPLPALAQEFTLLVNTEKSQNPTVAYEAVDADRIKAIVTDESGRMIGGLEMDDFEIRTELSKGVIYKVEPLLHTEKANVAIVLCIDNSNSMSRYINLLKSTLDALLRHFGSSVNISSVFFSEGFSGQHNLQFEAPKNIRIYPFTLDKNVLRDAYERHLADSVLSAKTYLFDQLFCGINIFEQITDPETKRFIIALSDGQDNGSQYKEPDIRSLAGHHPEIVFYTIDYLQKTNRFLSELAQNSNGRYFQAGKAEELALIFEDITQDIVNLNGYLITYRIPRATVKGRVLSRAACQPLTSAKVECYPAQRSDYKKTLTLNASGIFDANLDVAYRWVMGAAAVNHLPDSVFIDINEEDFYSVHLNLNPAHVQLTGRILDSGTAPLADARISVTELSSGQSIYEGLSDSLGVYWFEGRYSGDYLITATKEGYSYGSVDVLAVTLQTTIPDISLGLTSEGFVSEFRFLFEFNSDRLNLSDVATQTQLRDCVDFVQRELEKSETRMVRLVGWTDSVGTVAYNLELSQRRAQNIKSYLMKYAIPRNRIEIEGKGISFKYDNESEEGRALNRRTDVVFFDRSVVSGKQ